MRNLPHSTLLIGVERCIMFVFVDCTSCHVRRVRQSSSRRQLPHCNSGLSEPREIDVCQEFVSITETDHACPNLIVQDSSNATSPLDLEVITNENDPDKSQQRGGIIRLITVYAPEAHAPAEPRSP
jgi:hypothetical protein